VLLVVVPFLWNAWNSRPSNTTSGVPVGAAYWGPCQRFPRFTSYAVLTILMELYSTGVAAMAVAVAPCDAAPWKGVVLYCSGVLVAVARAYSAVVALRLQDELAAACRKVVPLKEEDLASEGKVFGLTTGDIQFGLDCGEGVGMNFEAEASAPQPVMESRLVENEEPKGGICRWLSLSLPEDSDKVRNINDPDPMACAFLPAWCCPVLRRRLAGKRWYVWAGIALFLASAVVSALVVRTAVGQAPREPEQMSSCGVGQNATSTGLDYAYVGQNLYDDTGEAKMDMANSVDACCQGCDSITNCQAWIYERVGKRCRWIRFIDEVCHENPGDLRCRCTAHSETVFGFKPKMKPVWLRRSD